MIVTPVSGHNGATGIVKERMEVMEALGNAIKSLVAMLKRQAQFNQDSVKATANKMAAHGTKIKAQFPAGSDHKPTRALPAVWKNRADFDKLADQLTQAAKALEKSAGAAKSAKNLAPHIIAIGKTCKSCHEKYRAPDKQALFGGNGSGDRDRVKSPHKAAKRPIQNLA